MAKDTTDYVDIATLDEVDQELIIDIMRNKTLQSLEKKANENWERELKSQMDSVMAMVDNKPIAAPGFGKMKMVPTAGRVSTDKVKIYMAEKLKISSAKVAECMEACTGDGSKGTRFYPEKAKKQ